jgi:hypothetical protein
VIRSLCSRDTWRLVALTALVVIIAGCAPPPPAATPTATKTVRPAATPALPTATVLVPTIAPSATPEPPTATPEPTPEPTVEPTATEPSTEAMPVRQPGVSIFTGLRPADPSVLERRPIALKVDNDPAVVPQSGFSKADVVVEHPKEGCLTRMTAIYQSQDAPRVGSLRSARLVDVELPVIFDAIIAFSGAVEPVRQALYKSDIGPQVLEQARNGAAFFRDPNIRVPFNLFANTATIWNIGSQRGWNNAPDPTAAWVFSEGAPEGGTAATGLAIPYPKSYRQLHVAWNYDAGSGRWLRTIGGNPHIEKVDGKQLSAATVVVLTANVVQTLIPEQGTQLTQGPCSNASLEIQLWGQGPVRIFRDGRVYEGKWVRTDRRAPFRFVDAQGKDLPLKPGNSWWQIVASDMQVTVK